MQDKWTIIFWVMFYIDEDFNNWKKWKKKYHFEVKLQSRELNLVLRKTAMIVTEYYLQLG